MAQRRSSTRVVGLVVLAAVVLAAVASLPAATAYGCYDDCYERCANGKDDPACTKMCNQACGSVDLGAATAGLAAGTGAAAAKQGLDAVQQGAAAAPKA